MEAGLGHHRYHRSYNILMESFGLKLDWTGKKCMDGIFEDDQSNPDSIIQTKPKVLKQTAIGCSIIVSLSLVCLLLETIIGIFQKSLTIYGSLELFVNETISHYKLFLLLWRRWIIKKWRKRHVSNRTRNRSQFRGYDKHRRRR